MQYQNKYWKKPFKRGLKNLQKAVEQEYYDKAAKRREKIVLFYQKNGLKLTQEANEVKRSTLHSWQRVDREYGVIGLINGDRTPKRKRDWSRRIHIEISSRTRQYSIDKEEIKRHLIL
jgi:hypothetical protein